MYDIHSHIIYGIDDGSPDETTSRGLLDMAVASGTSHIVATPHVIEVFEHPSWERIQTGVEELRGFATEANLDLTIYPGSEVMLSLDILKVYDEAPHAYCLNGTRYALIELPMLEVPKYTEDCLYEMQLRGLTPVLAHPERYPQLFESTANMNRLLEWCHKGVLLQCNGGSILGKFGHRAKDNLELLLHNKLVSFIGSDAHRIKHRNTDLAEERTNLTEICGQAYADAICIHNPKAMLADEQINIRLPKKLEQKPQPKKSFWSKLFG